jgi:hydroxymethylpyrimidine pyrophosphatase-like HAD family hydrolase
VTSIELVVTDLDGTLWHTTDEVHPGTAAAWAEVARQVPILVATGRRVASTREPLARLGVQPPAVVLNGALALDLATGRAFHRSPFPAAQAASVLAAFQEAGLDPCLYIEEDDRGVEVLLSDTPSTNPGHVRQLGRGAAVTDLDAAVRDVPILAFSLIGVPHGPLAAAAAAVGGTAEVHLDRSLEYAGTAAITVAPLGQSKWDGVEAFCRREGLDSTRVLALGDGPNDVELLTAAAVRVVPEVAHPAARELADHTIAAPQDGGWLALPRILAELGAANAS